MIIKRFFKLIGSVLALCIALIGFLLPIIPGWPFIFIAIILISPTRGKKIIQNLKDKLKRKIKKKSSEE